MHEYKSTRDYHHQYCNVIVGAVASQIISLTVVYSTVYSGADRRKHQSSASLAFVRGIHRSPVNSPHKRPVTRKIFPFDDVIMFINVLHYIDVIMTTMASQITSLAVVYSSVYLDADQRKHQSSASLAYAWGIHRERWIPRTKGQLRGKCFHLMTSSCAPRYWTGSFFLIFCYCSHWDILPWHIEIETK